MSLFVLASVSVPWAAIMIVGGLWLIFAVRASTMFGRVECLVAGAAALAAGHVVFLACVADRLFPRAGRAVGPWLEIPACVMLFAGIVWVTWAVLSG